MRLSEPIDKAANYLLQRRGWTGLWWDFLTGAGYSDEWLSAFVASVLAKLPGQKYFDAVCLTWSRLIARHPACKGWGYSADTPQDADSTIWVLNLATILGENNRRIDEAHAFLIAHCRMDGGVSTYSSGRDIRRFVRLDPTVSFAGWCSSHTDVTANAANHIAFAQRAAALEYLRKNQQADGSWRGYWWSDPEYTSALAVKALSKTGKPEDRLCIRKAVQLAIEKLEPTGAVHTVWHPRGSTFATALALQILLRTEEIDIVRRSIEKSVSWLLSKQTKAGFWHSSAAMRLPHPADRNPDLYKHWNKNGRGELGDIIFDVRRIFTTATVLETLIDVRSLILGYES